MTAERLSLGVDLNDSSSYLQPTCAPNITGHSFINEGSLRDWGGRNTDLQKHKPDGETLVKDYNTPQ